MSEDIFSALGGMEVIGGDVAPSPIILPEIGYEFGRQFGGDGKVVAILFQFHIRSLPLVKFVIPFDRISYAKFAADAQIPLGVLDSENGGDIIKGVD